jgi:hypothetical protein
MQWLEPMHTKVSPWLRIYGRTLQRENEFEKDLRLLWDEQSKQSL